MEQVVQVLKTMDPENDALWTSDELPRIEVVNELTGQKNLKRKDITDALPGFTRSAQRLAKLQAPPTEPDGETATSTEQPAVAEKTSPDVREKPLDEDAEQLSALCEDLLHNKPQLVSKTDCEAYLEATTEACNALHKIIQRSQLKLNQVARAADIVSQHVQREFPERQNDGIKAYLDGQRQARAARAARVSGLINAGISPSVLAQALQGSSKLDQAMSHRKPALGATRPEFGLPVQRGSVIDTK